MTTRIINGVKFDYEIAERTEKELLEIAAQDESFDMEDFETPEVKIAVGDVYIEFMSWETYELKNANDAAVDFLEKITPEVGADLYVEDEPKHSYYDIDLDYEDGEMTITDVNHYIMF